MNKWHINVQNKCRVYFYTHYNCSLFINYSDANLAREKKRRKKREYANRHRKPVNYFIIADITFRLPRLFFVVSNTWNGYVYIYCTTYFWFVCKYSVKWIKRSESKVVSCISFIFMCSLANLIKNVMKFINIIM